MWRYDTKCKYMFMFSLKNSARKGLIMSPMLLVNNESYVALYAESAGFVCML